MAWVLTPALLLLAVRPWSQYLISPCLDFIPKMRDNNSIYHLRSLCRLNGITQIKWLAQFYITVNTYALYFNIQQVLVEHGQALCWVLGRSMNEDEKPQALLLCSCSGLGYQDVQWAQVQPCG